MHEREANPGHGCPLVLRPVRALGQHTTHPPAARPGYARIRYEIRLGCDVTLICAVSHAVSKRAAGSLARLGWNVGFQPLGRAAKRIPVRIITPNQRGLSHASAARQLRLRDFAVRDGFTDAGEDVLNLAHGWDATTALRCRQEY